MLEPGSLRPAPTVYEELPSIYQAWLSYFCYFLIGENFYLVILICILLMTSEFSTLLLNILIFCLRLPLHIRPADFCCLSFSCWFSVLPMLWVLILFCFVCYKDSWSLDSTGLNRASGPTFLRTIYGINHSCLQAFEKTLCHMLNSHERIVSFCIINSVWFIFFCLITKISCFGVGAASSGLFYS